MGFRLMMLKQKAKGYAMYYRKGNIVSNGLGIASWLRVLVDIRFFRTKAL